MVSQQLGPLAGCRHNGRRHWRQPRYPPPHRPARRLSRRPTFTPPSAVSTSAPSRMRSRPFVIEARRPHRPTRRRLLELHARPGRRSPLTDLAYPDPETGRADWKGAAWSMPARKGNRHPESQEPYIRRQAIAALDADVLILGHEQPAYLHGDRGPQGARAGSHRADAATASSGHAPGFASIELGHRGSVSASLAHVPGPAALTPDRPGQRANCPRRRGCVTRTSPVTEAVVRRVREASHHEQLTTPCPGRRATA